MTIRSHFARFVPFILILAIFFTACNEDDEPDKTSVFGTITIDNVDTWANWVDSGEVQVTIFPEFSLDPLAGWGAIPDDFFGPGSLGGTYAAGAPFNSQNPVILDYEAGKTSFEYEIEVDPGTYSALALGFRHDLVNDPSLKTATLGVHWDNETEVSHGVVIRIDAGGNIITVFDYAAPSTFEVQMGEQKEINFEANFEFVEMWYQ